MRISDWSSDVCSSDLDAVRRCLRGCRSLHRCGRDHQPVMGLCGQLPEHADMIKMASRNRRRLRKLEQAIRLMAPRDQMIFRGHFVDDAPFTEIADWHGISVAEVEAALCRGLEILADVLELIGRTHV